MEVHDFRSWLIGEVQDVLNRKTAIPPLLLRLDPDRPWFDLLRSAATVGKFEIWADSAEHELIVRDRFYRTPRGARVVSRVLKSGRAVEVNIAIMRAFVRIGEIMSTHKGLAGKLDELERKLGQHDEKFALVFEAIRQLMTPPPSPPKPRIGFRQD